ncbi:MAG: hypothetical protein IJ214_01485 [Clostridia bacterium]|nr:hypothetical protein [Clostridia bacterium]
MNILQEIEAMRKRMIQEVNTEFDILIEHLTKEENAGMPKETVSPYEMKYPLSAGAAIFKGKKPTGVMIGNKNVSIRTWKQLVEVVLQHCMASPVYRERLLALAGNVSGKKRTLLAETDEGMRSPIHIRENLFMETHYDTQTLLNILMHRLLIPIGYDVGSISVTIRNV